MNNVVWEVNSDHIFCQQFVSSLESESNTDHTAKTNLKQWIFSHLNSLSLRWDQLAVMFGGACQVSSSEDSISAVELRNTLPCKVYDDFILFC